MKTSVMLFLLSSRAVYNFFHFIVWCFTTVKHLGTCDLSGLWLLRLEFLELFSFQNPTPLYWLNQVTKIFRIFFIDGLIVVIHKIKLIGYLCFVLLVFYQNRLSQVYSIFKNTDISNSTYTCINIVIMLFFYSDVVTIIQISGEIGIIGENTARKIYRNIS